MVIYKTTNLLNGKYYVGKDEKNNPKYLGSGKILKTAITKYGLENFKKEILESCKTKEELNEKEVYWINSLSAITLGYNITDGGTGGRTKFNKIYQFDKSGVLIKEWDSAAEINRVLKFDQSSILKACKGKLLSVNGFIWSYTNKVKPFVDTRTIEILQYNRKGELVNIWPSIVKVKEEMGISDRQIQLTLDKLNLTAKGFIWLRKKGKIENKITIIKSGHFGNKNAAKNNK
jgi:hypothetical protein